MLVSQRAVRVFEVPHAVTEADRDAFLSELSLYVENERPRFVLDCSLIVEMDLASIKILLGSLEEAMKCNGDVRLAGLTNEATSSLRKIGITRIFETYQTTELAIQSYKRASSLTPYTRRRQDRARREAVA